MMDATRRAPGDQINQNFLPLAVKHCKEAKTGDVAFGIGQRATPVDAARRRMRHGVERLAGFAVNSLADMSDPPPARAW
jgi:hypothetical protein